MEILRMFVDPLEDLCDLLLVFFAFQNFLPRRPIRHLDEFKHVINEYPAQYQNRNIHEVALSARKKALYHLPRYCVILVILIHQSHIHNREAFRSSSNQFFQSVLVVNNGLGQMSANVAQRVREGHAFPSSTRTLIMEKGPRKGVPAVDLSAIRRSDPTPRQAILRLSFIVKFRLRL